MPRLLVLSALLTCFVANVQVSAAEDVRDKLRDVYASMAKKAKEARKEYHSDLARAGRSAISQYERLAAEAVRKGDLTAATEAWRQVLAIDRAHQKAVDYFTSLGRLDAELKKLEGRTSLDELEQAASAGGFEGASKVSDTVWNWTANRRMVLKRDGTSLIADGQKITKSSWTMGANGRVFIERLDGSGIIVMRLSPEFDSYEAIWMKAAEKFTGNRAD